MDHNTLRQTSKSNEPNSKAINQWGQLVDIIQKLAKTDLNDNIRHHQWLSTFHNNNKSIPSVNNVKSSRTSNVKEEKNNKDFISNFMYKDDEKMIDPENMHLLTDDDTKQSVTFEEKCRKLSDLLSGAQESMFDNFFIQSDFEKITGYLFTTLSNKAKEVFIEDNRDKIRELQSFFKRINNIKLPEWSQYTPKQFTEDSLRESEVDYIMNNSTKYINSEFLGWLNHNIITIENWYNSEYISSTTVCYPSDGDDKSSGDIQEIKAIELEETVLDALPICSLKNVENLCENDSSKANKTADIFKKNFSVFTLPNDTCSLQEYTDITSDPNAIKKMDDEYEYQNEHALMIEKLIDLDEKYFKNELNGVINRTNNETFKKIINKAISDLYLIQINDTFEYIMTTAYSHCNTQRNKVKAITPKDRISKRRETTILNSTVASKHGITSRNEGKNDVVQNTESQLKNNLMTDMDSYLSMPTNNNLGVTDKSFYLMPRNVINLNLEGSAQMSDKSEKSRQRINSMCEIRQSNKQSDKNDS